MEDPSVVVPLTKDIISETNALSHIDKCPFTLQYAFSTLKLIGKSIKDISIISEYPHLSDVDLSNNKINEVASLSSLCGLRKLKLSQNMLSDTLNYQLDKCTSELIPIDPEDGKTTAWVNGFNNVGSLLEDVQLDCNQITTITPSLSTHTFITQLNLSHNKIDKIENLEGLKHLKILDLSFNNIKIVEGLDANVKLSILNLESNQIKSLETFPSTLIELASLILNGNQISSLKGMEVCSSLKSLEVKSNLIWDINEVNYIKGLLLLHNLSLYCRNEKSTMFYNDVDSDLKTNSNEILGKQHYRLRVIHRLPQLQMLDNWLITAEETRHAYNLYCTGGELRYRKENFDLSFPRENEAEVEEQTVSKLRVDYKDCVTPYNDAKE